MAAGPSTMEKKLSNGNVVNLFGADLQKVRKAIADLESPDNDVFKEAYHWVFNSPFFLEDGFEQTCQRAGVSFVGLIDKTEQKRPALERRYESILFGVRGRDEALHR